MSTVSHLTAQQAGTIAQRGRKLLRAGKLTHRQLAVLDCLLWSCRRPGSASAVVSYSGLQRLARVSRATIAGAISALEELGLIQRVKRRLRLAWHQGGQRVRQLANAYVLRAEHCEFSARPLTQGIEILQEVPAPIERAAQAALAARRRVVEARLLGKAKIATP